MWRVVEGDLAAVLRVPMFRSYAISRVTAGVGQSMLQAIIAWQVYALSGSALDLGLIGLTRFIPALSLSLISGVVVDTYDCRRILLIAQALPVLTSLAMLAAIATGHVTLALIYAIVFVAGVVSASKGRRANRCCPRSYRATCSHAR